MHTKSYHEHVRNAQYCGMQWRILKLDEARFPKLAETLPKVRVVRTRCHSKACPSCQLLYYRNIRKKVRTATISNQWRMFTLTGIHHLHDEQEDLIRLEANFRELRKKLKRKFPDFKYFAVKELSPDGNWHYHGLWNIYIPFLELVKMWKEISGAHRVWLSQVKNPRRAVNYVFKYCFKSVNNKKELEYLYECDKRKFSSSKGLLSKDKNPNPYVSEFGVQYGLDELKETLFNIVSTSDLSIDDFHSIDYPYFEDLMLNLFDKMINEHPPNLFEQERFASLAEIL